MSISTGIDMTDITPWFVISWLWDTLGSELALLGLFCAGFVLFRIQMIQRFIGLPVRRSKPVFERCENDPTAAWMAPVKQLEANWAAGRADLVLSGWPSLNHFTIEALKAVVEALVSTRRGQTDRRCSSELSHDINSVIQQILVKHDNMCSKEAMHVALDALPASMPQLSGSVRSLFLKALTRGSRTSSPFQPATASTCPVVNGYAMRITAAVQSLDFDTARKEMLSMSKSGYKVPASSLVLFARTASDEGLAGSTLKDLPPEVFSADGMVGLLEYATKRGNSKLLREMYLLSNGIGLLKVPAVCDALLRSYASLGDSRAVEVFDDLLSHGFIPSEGALTAIISLCAESRHVQLAEHAFTYARQAKLNLTLSLYASIIKVYGHAQLFQKICNLYDMMRQDEVKPDTVVYGSLIKAAVESGRLELARRLFRESGNPDLLNYMSLIRAAGREKDLPKALELLDELEAAPISIDATAYNCVMEVCVASGNHGAARTLLKRMENKDHVDVVSYNTYLKILFANDARPEIESILQSMRSRGLRPNNVTYNSLIKDAIMRQDLSRAWGLIAQMEEEGTNPDAFTCSILMKGVKHASSSEAVDRVVQLIQRAKVTPDEVLVNCLLEAYVRLRNIPRLTQILEQFKSTGVVPSPHACALLIKAYGHAQRLDCAWALWHELINERKVTPDEEVFGSMVDACLASGDLENAVAIFRQMKHVLSEFSHPGRAATVFGNLVKACVSRKQTKLAVNIYEDMQDVSFTYSRVTYNTLIDSLVRQGDMERATAVFRDMELRGVTPDLVSYGTLIKGHCAQDHLDQGLQLLGLMQRRGISPDAIVFNSILDGCAHKQMRTLTEQVLKDMENANIFPSNFTLSILVKLYGRCNDLDAAFHVVETYPVKYKFKVNAQVYTCLMSACIANGSLPKALDVYRSMVESYCPADAKMYQTLLNGCVRHGDLDAAARLVRDAVQKVPAPLDRDTADNVLFMMVRRGRGLDLAAPLMGELEAAGVRVSGRVSSAIRKSDGSPSSRNFSRGSA